MKKLNPIFSFRLTGHLLSPLRPLWIASLAGFLVSSTFCQISLVSSAWAAPQKGPKRTPAKSNAPADEDSKQSKSDPVEKENALLGAKLKEAAQLAPQKANWAAQVIRTNDPKQSIKDLKLSETTLPVTLMPKDNLLRPMMEVKGTFTRTGWDLYFQNDLILKVKPNRTSFSFFVYLNSKNSTLTLTAKGPDGPPEIEKLVVFAPGAQEFRLTNPWGELYVHLGAAILNYYQTSYGNFNSTSGLLAITYIPPKGNLFLANLNALVDFRSTLLTFSAGPDKLGPQIMQGKLDFTYPFGYFLKGLIQPTAILGASYLTMLSNGSPFGFANLLSPEIGVRIFSELENDGGVNLTFRYTPLDDFLNATQRGLDLRLNYSMHFSNNHRLTLELGLIHFLWQAAPLIKIETSMPTVTLSYTL